MQEGKKPSVQKAAALCRKLCYENKDALQASLIVAGLNNDNENGIQGDDAGQVYCIPLGGSMHESPYAIGGSGSTYIYGYCDAYWKPGMTREECQIFVVNGI